MVRATIGISHVFVARPTRDATVHHAISFPAMWRSVAWPSRAECFLLGPSWGQVPGGNLLALYLAPPCWESKRVEIASMPKCGLVQKVHACFHSIVRCCLADPDVGNLCRALLLSQMRLAPSPPLRCRGVHTDFCLVAPRATMAIGHRSRWNKK